MAQAQTSQCVPSSSVKIEGRRGVLPVLCGDREGDEEAEHQKRAHNGKPGNALRLAVHGHHLFAHDGFCRMLMHLMWISHDRPRGAGSYRSALSATTRTARWLNSFSCLTRAAWQRYSHNPHPTQAFASTKGASM